MVFVVSVVCAARGARRRVRRPLTLLTLAALGCAPPPAAAPPAAPAPAGAAAAPARAAPAGSMPSISADALRRDLVVFAADSFMGRETGTEYAVKAARFIAARLAELGVEPAGDSGGYFQRISLSREAFGSGTSLAVADGRGTTPILLGAEGLVPITSLAPGVLTRLSADGELVFAGYALSLPQLGRDDLANLDVGGKVVVFLQGAPPAASLPGLDSAQRAQLEDQAQTGMRLERVLSRRPAAVIVLVGGKVGEDFALGADEMLNALSLNAPPSANAPRGYPMVLLGRARVGSPLLPAGYPRDDKPQALRGRRFTARVALEQGQVAAYNVVGIVRGSDPALNASYVAFGAHLDHIGVQRPASGDSIANGADDDGSGSMALVQIAGSWARAPQKPRRSALFVWHTGEEKGLLGSQYFITRPTVPLDSIVAQLNADMIGRNAADSLYIVGPSAAENGQSRVLGTIVDSVNAVLPRPFAFNREWDSPTHPERIYYRSDHYSYAQRGIPIIFFTSGLHPDYHRVSDELSKIDYDKLARVSTLIMETGVAVANRPARPRPGAR